MPSLRKPYFLLKKSAREFALKTVSAVSRLRGIDCLDRIRTIELCDNMGYGYVPGEPTTLGLGGPIRSLEILPCGVVRINRSSCLYTDFGNRAAVRTRRNPLRTVKHAIALWSHPDWVGFHHFLTEIFPKICKMKEALGEELREAKFCYPMIHRRYESELLAMAGIGAEQLVDTRATGGVVAERLTFIPMNGWFGGNPNADLLRKRFVDEASPPGPERLYLMRTGRRKCLNEADLVGHLSKLGFETIDESSRSIQQQILLYRDARILVGPHGSAFSNMVWAKPGLQVVEIVPSTFDVPYHRELSASLGHNYTKILCENGFHSTKGTLLDFHADIPRTMQAVERHLSLLSH